MTCEPAERIDGRRRHDLTLAILATIVFALLSLPAHWGFDFWAESEPLWIAHFAVGALLSVPVCSLMGPAAG